MARLQIYTPSGVKKGTMEYPREFSAKENLQLLAQAIRVYQDRSHQGTSKAKTRGQVNASGAKIYRQKGTGRARHGDVKAPIFVGGGVAHGPKGIKRKLTLPKNMRRKALKVALSLKVKQGQIFVLDNLSNIKKAKDANKLLESITKKEFEKIPRKAVLVLSKENWQSLRYFRNIKDLEIMPFESLNAKNVFLAGAVFIDRMAFAKKKKADGIKETKQKVKK